ncbi:hypothetical protein CR152_10975 [Massilia violaceinigra]|uniref:Uncharacterized protein n=1 Tax=Massilia violaceinigra TaxID=2045208 RepID=A0A2D2DJ34_9BURK|nr:hypothetical protein CR152_10975 [Massilia violaceinigra]
MGALFHRLPKVPAAQCVRHKPADANQEHIDQKAHPFEGDMLIRKVFGFAVYLMDLPTGRLMQQTRKLKRAEKRSAFHR